MKKNQKYLLFLLVLLALLVISCLLSIAIGARKLPIHSVLGYLSGHEIPVYEKAVIDSRIPRTLFGLMAGAALGVSGTLMQTITRNPIADPSILGVNSGAAFFVVCGMVFFHVSSGNVNIWLAFAGALLTAFLVYAMASFQTGQASPIRLALAGAAAATALSSLTSAVILPSASAMDKFRFWQVGSLGGADFADIAFIWPYLLIGLVMAFVLAPKLNILALGDEMASSLGIKVERIRALAALAGVLLSASVTALAGPIAFVGLMVPHLIRLAAGANLKWNLPLAALAGGILLLSADVIGRVLGGSGELEVGIVTALLGAPFFIYVVRKAKVQAL